MPRYIDVEGYRKLFDAEYKKTRDLINQGETHLDNIAEGFSEASRVIDRIPLADVVPKVELDAMRGAANSYKMHYEKTKNELAREVFEEIENKKIFLKDHAGNMGVVVMLKDIAELQKKYSKRYFKEDGEDTNAPAKVSSGEIVKDHEHRCMFCQEIVPQGIDVCPKCEKERG